MPFVDDNNPVELDCTTPRPNELNVVAPVTPSVPPIVSLPTTLSDALVTAPRFVPPVTVSELSVDEPVACHGQCATNGFVTNNIE